MDKRAENIKKYETMAAAVKAFSPNIKMTLKEIAATFYHAAMNRQNRQAREMGRNQRMSRMPAGVGDVQRKLDIGK
jgi:hypothetical protein